MRLPRPGHPGLLILSAPSGAGKTTLCQRLLADFPDELELSISATTRAPRAGETEGVHYIFLSASEFRKRVKQDQFAEWAAVHGNLYGTLKPTIEKAFQLGRSVVLDIDVQGAAQLRKAYPDRCFGVFIAPPSLDELKVRLERRGTDSAETIAKRMRNAETEMARKDEFDEVLVNHELEAAYATLRAWVLARLGRSPGAGRG
ncbi:MAG: guanylate kinase [Bdellovibrionales bacterium]|nr:guanylate kinase [Bdellovibrionales bacterium]